MDRETVIRDLEYLVSFGGASQQSMVMQIATEALILLKEQETIEPRKKDDGNPQPWTSWWYVCGDCGQEIEYHDRYCRWCGRAVQWDG